MNQITRLLTLTLFATTQAIALVDYTAPENPVSVTPSKQGASSIKRIPRNQSQRSSNAGPKFLDIGMSYRSVDVKSEDRSGKIAVTEAKATFRTDYNLFLETSYSYAASVDKQLAENTSNDQGNPLLKLGVNWLKLGNDDGAVLVDLTAALSIAQENSSLGNSRNDKIFGIHTSKRFGPIAFGIGYDYNLTGGPKDGDELDIGNIGKFTAGLGWMVSQDIKISLEASSYTIASSEETNGLAKDLSYSTINPELQLNLGPSLILVLGADLQLERAAATEQDLTQAQLYNLPGLYGNSLYSGLHLSI